KAKPTRKAQFLAQAFQSGSYLPASALPAWQPGRFGSRFQIGRPPHILPPTCAARARWHLPKVDRLAVQVGWPWPRFATVHSNMWLATTLNYSKRKRIVAKSPGPFHNVGSLQQPGLFHQEQYLGWCDNQGRWA